MTAAPPAILCQSSVVDAIAAVGLGYVALVGVAAVRDRTTPRMAYGLSLLTAAVAGLVAWLGTVATQRRDETMGEAAPASTPARWSGLRAELMRLLWTF